MNKKVQRINALQAFLVSLLLVLNGFNVYGEYPWIGTLNIIFGCFILIYAINTFRGKSNPTYKGISLFMEGVGLLLAAYIFHDKDTDYLHFAFVLAALLCFTGAAFIFRKMKRR